MDNQQFSPNRWLRNMEQDLHVGTMYCRGYTNDPFDGGMRNFVSHFATNAGRMVATSGHARAREILLRVMSESQHSSIGLAPYEGSTFQMTYSYDGFAFNNLVGVLKSRVGGKPVLLGAHYDTCGPYPGADDNAAAVSIVFNVLTKMRLYGNLLKRDLIIAFFDAEEPPYFLQREMGSTHFFHHQMREAPALAIVMDLIGHDVPLRGAESLLAITGVESHPDCEALLNTAPTGSYLKIVPTINSYVGDMSDHHVFRTNHVPYLFLSCGRWPHYHQPTDTPDRLNYNKMEAIAQYVTRLIAHANDLDFASTHTTTDTTSTELRFIRNSLGDVLASYGLPVPTNRTGIERMVWTFMNLGI